MNFIPQETIACDDRDPSWITHKVKDLIQKNTANKYYLKSNKSIQLFQIVRYFQNLLTTATEVSKQQYYTGKKLMDPI